MVFPQDLDHLYFVMDYIPGGDLMSLLIKKGIFEEPLSQFYIAGKSQFSLLKSLISPNICSR